MRNAKRQTTLQEKEEGGYPGMPIIQCPRCNYVGGAAPPPFNPADLLGMVPHVGHFLVWLFHRNKKKLARLCPICDYENPPVLPPAEARRILGEYNFKTYLESQKKRKWPLSSGFLLLVLLVLLVLLYFLWRSHF